MADDPVINLDAIGDIDDDQELQATLQRLQGQQPQEPPAEPEKVEVKVEPETLPSPAVAEPEKKPEAVAEPAKPKPEDDAEARANRAFKRIRLLEQEIETLRAQREQQPPAVADQPKPPTYQDDPAEFLKGKTESLEQEIQRLRGENEQSRAMLAAQQQEESFTREHPDYPKAREYLEQSEIKEWEESGLAVAGVAELRRAIALEKQGDARFKGYDAHVRKIMTMPDIQAEAERLERPVEDVAMHRIMRDTYINGRRALIQQGATAAGDSVASRAYRLAQIRGWSAPAPEPKPAPTQQQVDTEAARQRVLQSQAIREAANSLSESGSADGAPQPRVIRSRNDIIQADDAVLDALIESGQFRNI